MTAGKYIKNLNESTQQEVVNKAIIFINAPAHSLIACHVTSSLGQKIF